MMTELKCPKCGCSDKLQAGDKGFSLGKAIVGDVIAGPVGLLGGLIGSKKLQLTCLNCGHRWIHKRNRTAELREELKDEKYNFFKKRDNK